MRGLRNAFDAWSESLKCRLRDWRRAWKLASLACGRVEEGRVSEGRGGGSKSARWRGERRRERTWTDGLHGPVGTGGIPNSASVSSLTSGGATTRSTSVWSRCPCSSRSFAGAPSCARSSSARCRCALRSAVDCGAARSTAGGEDEPRRLLDEVGVPYGDEVDEVGRVTPERGEAPREAAPLMRVRAGGVAGRRKTESAYGSESKNERKEDARAGDGAER